MSSSESAPRIRFQSAAAALAVTLGLAATACSSSSKSAAPLTATTLPPGTSVPPGYVGATKVPDAAVDAIRAYEVKNGPPLGSWTITGVQVSTVDPTYVLYRISPAAGHESEVQGGYGFVRKQQAKWVVLGFGSDAVGCPPGAPNNPAIPEAVLTSFDLTCPRGGSGFSTPGG